MSKGIVKDFRKTAVKNYKSPDKSPFFLSLKDGKPQ